CRGSTARPAVTGRASHPRCAPCHRGCASAGRRGKPAGQRRESQPALAALNGSDAAADTPPPWSWPPGRSSDRAAAVSVQMMKAPYRPISGLRCATRAKAMHSGTRAKEVVRPARTSARRRAGFMKYLTCNAQKGAMLRNVNAHGQPLEPRHGTAMDRAGVQSTPIV
nr:hypothetical protein [Tanacetum cinerariifolium]